MWYVHTHTHAQNGILCCAESLSHGWLFATPWTVAHQAPLSMGILQAWRLVCVAMPSSRESSQPRDLTQVSHIAGRFFTSWATREVPNGILLSMKKNEIMPCAATWTRDYYTKWKKSERERQIPYDITYMCIWKYDTN